MIKLMKMTTSFISCATMACFAIRFALDTVASLDLPVIWPQWLKKVVIS